MLNITPYEEKLKKVCVEKHLKKLDLFGSATNDSFGDDSDIDIIVEFDKQTGENLFDKYFELKEELGAIFHRPIDIVIESSIRNPFLKESISQTRRSIYVS